MRAVDLCSLTMKRMLGLKEGFRDTEANKDRVKEWEGGMEGSGV
jgi:hypothetical protein